VRYLFGDLEADADQRALRRGGERVAMEPQAFDVLIYLLRHRQRVVPKEELMDNVWGGRFVSETAVTSRIKQVRRAVGDDGTSQTHERTYHGRGYRFVAEVTESNQVVAGSAAPGRSRGEAPAHVVALPRSSTGWPACVA
jgi:DNA-binding winged helix-turn-helix (wHTH) protein